MSVAHELAWAAGFFDGEGYVTIQYGYTKSPNGKRYPRHTLRIGINHVAPEPLYEMQRLFGGSIEKQKLESVHGNRHPRHRWVLNCSNAAEALKSMMPYFRNKQKVAELGLELQNTMGNTGERVTEDLLVYRALLKERVTNLNSMD